MQFINGTFFSMSCDIVLAISRLFSSPIYKAARFFTHSEREREEECSSVEKIECSQKDVDLW